MRQALPNNVLHNPFHNRSNYPVTQRRDDMQAYANVVWMRERSEGLQTNANAELLSKIVDEQRTSSSKASPPDWGELTSGVLPLLLILLVSVFMLWKAF